MQQSLKRRNSRIVVLSFSIVILFISSCTDTPGGKSDGGEAKSNSTMQEGKDFVILKRFRCEDKMGFNQPVEVSSFLLPANWQVASDVKWYPSRKCIPEMVQASVEAHSPDNKFELTYLPVTQFDWSDDPVYLDAMRRGFNPHSCNIAQPLDAAGYIAKGLAARLNAQVKKSEPIRELQALMDQGAEQMTYTARQAGNFAYNHRGSAAEGVLQFSDGKEGIALCTLMQTIVSLPGSQGGMTATYQCYVSMLVLIRYEVGEEAMARKILSTFMGNSRINPQWANAVATIFRNIGRDAQIQIGKQIEITRQMQEQISNNIVRDWEKTSDKNSETQQQFSQYLRGVDSWTDEGGNKVELTDGYSNAWSKGDGTYLLTNNPALDPNVEFKEGWKRLNR